MYLNLSVDMYKGVNGHNKNKNRAYYNLNVTDPYTGLQVVRGFMSNKENKNKFDVVNDKRVNTHNLGVALQLKYKNPSPEQTPTK